MNIQALGESILIEKVETENVTKSGIFTGLSLPRGKVISKGDKVSESICVGDVVLHSSIPELAIEGNFVIIKEEDVLAKII